MVMSFLKRCSSILIVHDLDKKAESTQTESDKDFERNQLGDFFEIFSFFRLQCGA